MRSFSAAAGSGLLWLFLGSILLLVVSARPFGVSSFKLTGNNNPQANQLLQRHLLIQQSVSVRGGAASTLVDSDDEEEESEDEEEEEEKVDLDEEEEEEEEIPKKKAKATLAASAVKAASKSKAKKTASVKAAIKTGLADTPTVPKKKKSGLLSILKIPYIIKASLNPMTLFAMTKAYWGSLFNLNYIKKDTSQDLRSALEEKAKRAAGGGSKPKRKFKPGQAKSLSDLPPLNT
ncbi:expressed unknown protein [Seminavis robusta]|uniref:Uncharacterized protein n=1 Tax=Seminavis robusta TaxID=568900 RepID=A0A9N8ETM1_9STRA|nr:expressed unknown protein [Seminavis robusta]|eukprot:Sro1917_g305270.1 n/a (234) ;mRNA; f:1091-1885